VWGQPGAAPRRGNPTPKNHPHCVREEGVGYGGVHVSTMSGWRRQAGPGPQAARVTGGRRSRRRCVGGAVAGASVAGAGGKYGRRQAEEAGVTADGRRTRAWSTVGGRRKRRKSRRRQAEEAGNYSTADGRRKRRELRQMVGGRARADGYGRRQAEEAEVTATAGERGAGE
jgi:hypothetical protein